jgi:uncharacterized protein
MSNPNVVRYREAEAALSRGDLELLRSEYLAPDVVWHFPGRNQFSGQYAGVDEVIGHLGKLLRHIESVTLSFSIHELFADDDHGVAIGMLRGKRGDKELQDRYAHVVHLREGRIVDSRMYYDDVYALDEFWFNGDRIAEGFSKGESSQ